MSDVDPLLYPEHTRPRNPAQLAALDRTRACAADSRGQLGTMAKAIAAAYPDAGDAYVVLHLRTGERAVHDACKITGGHRPQHMFGAAVAIAVAALERVRELEAQLAGGEPGGTIPVRVAPATVPHVARSGIVISSEHPLSGQGCPVCGGPLTGRLIDARHLNLIDLDGWGIGICYADCPRWHGCDCPPWSVL